MARPKTLEERLFAAAVLKMSFTLRGQLDSPAFRGIYPGVLRDLTVTEVEVDAYVQEHREEVTRAARGSTAAAGS
jgi:hypothetical protein